MLCSSPSVEGVAIVASWHCAKDPHVSKGPCATAVVATMNDGSINQSSQFSSFYMRVVG